MKSSLSFFLCFVLFLSCQESAVPETEVSESNLENELNELPIVAVDSLVKPNDSLQIGEISSVDVTNWTLDEFIVDCPKEMKSELKDYLRYERKQWEGVANPFIATYDGNDFGDYFHLIFTDANTKAYDFGFADNDFGGIQLYADDEQLTDNPQYLGRQFSITWAWKISSFPCCSGGYEIVEAYLPTITKLEMMVK